MRLSVGRVPTLVFAIATISLMVIYLASPRAMAQFPDRECDTMAPPTPLTVVLTPSDDVNFVGEDHTVTATVTPFIPGPDAFSVVTVEFDVSGANTASGLDFLYNEPGQATFTYTGINQGDDTITATASGYLWDSHGNCYLQYYTDSNTATATKHWTIFVIPESPIGIIALMGASLAALGGFMFWKRRSKPTDGMTGLGI
jgi:LPXTG-motif cell wall-anchored protein